MKSEELAVGVEAVESGGGFFEEGKIAEQVLRRFQAAWFLRAIRLRGELAPHAVGPREPTTAIAGVGAVRRRIGEAGGPAQAVFIARRARPSTASTALVRAEPARVKTRRPTLPGAQTALPTLAFLRDHQQRVALGLLGKRAQLVDTDHERLGSSSLVELLGCVRVFCFRWVVS
ncbi:hypothetical protein PtA15_10A303 [Puccinia triticina]|uniref:Uncharacterized protein n=1 Tax=Puccinia triticina TaxID=208348 RepID=A0ABY7CWQ2_9BASI|nr:uncharacterized protein PtA15_10A303 [Puccinia triticina]WAQ88882.1 hypothetical protein PtA15_10A303 [Puccinia triticina]